MKTVVLCFAFFVFVGALFLIAEIAIAWKADDDYKHGNGCITTATATICDYRHGYWDTHDRNTGASK